MMNNMRKGFSLAELGIALVILLIIATIAVISFFTFIDDSKETRMVETAKSIQTASLMSYATEGHFGTSNESLLDNVSKDTSDKICSIINYSLKDSNGNVKLTNSDNGIIITEELIEDFDKGTIRTGLLSVSAEELEYVESGNNGETDNGNGNLSHTNREILELAFSQFDLHYTFNIEETEDLINYLDNVLSQNNEAIKLGISSYFELIIFTIEIMLEADMDPGKIDPETMIIMNTITEDLIPIYNNSIFKDIEKQQIFQNAVNVVLSDLGYVNMSGLIGLSSISGVESITTSNELDKNNPCYLIEDGSLQVNKVDFDQLKKYLGPEVTRDDIDGFYIVVGEGNIEELSCDVLLNKFAVSYIGELDYGYYKGRTAYDINYNKLEGKVDNKLEGYYLYSYNGLESKVYYVSNGGYLQDVTNHESEYDIDVLFFFEEKGLVINLDKSFPILLDSNFKTYKVKDYTVSTDIEEYVGSDEIDLSKVKFIDNSFMYDINIFDSEEDKYYSFDNTSGYYRENKNINITPNLIIVEKNKLNIDNNKIYFDLSLPSDYFYIQTLYPIMYNAVIDIETEEETNIDYRCLEGALIYDIKEHVKFLDGEIDYLPLYEVDSKGYLNLVDVDLIKNYNYSNNQFGINKYIFDLDLEEIENIIKNYPGLIFRDVNGNMITTPKTAEKVYSQT